MILKFYLKTRFHIFNWNRVKNLKKKKKTKKEERFQYMEDAIKSVYQNCP